jgi:hypothetical protein
MPRWSIFSNNLPHLNYAQQSLPEATSRQPARDLRTAGLAKRTLHGRQAGNLPSVTGARDSVVLWADRISPA